MLDFGSARRKTAQQSFRIDWGRLIMPRSPLDAPPFAARGATYGGFRCLGLNSEFGGRHFRREQVDQPIAIDGSAAKLGESSSRR
jgi:hypothetical protein